MTTAIIASLLLAFGRAAAFMWTAPLIGDRTVPAKVRVIAAVGVALTIALARGPVSPETLVLALPTEIMLGALTGFAARLVLAAAEAAGQFLGLPFSLGFAATFDPAIGEAAMVTRRLVLALASLAFLAADGLAAGIRLMVLTPATADGVQAGIEVILDWSGHLLAIGLRFAAAATVAGSGWQRRHRARCSSRSHRSTSFRSSLPRCSSLADWSSSPSRQPPLVSSPGLPRLPLTSWPE